MHTIYNKELIILIKFTKFYIENKQAGTVKRLAFSV